VGSGEVIAALEGVRELVKEARRLAREAADKHGDTYDQLTTSFGSATNRRATRALDRLGQASECIGEADGQTAVALDDIAEYIEVVKGNGPAADGAGTGSERVPTPANPAPFHRRYLDALPSRATDDGPTDGTLTTVGGVKIEDVQSGQRGPGRGGPGLSPKFARMFTAADHAEGHAAALMRTSDVRHATLYINNRPCDYVPFGCDRILPHILRKGDTLTVYCPDGYVKVYTGNGKGLA